MNQGILKRIPCGKGSNKVGKREPATPLFETHFAAKSVRKCNRSILKIQHRKTKDMPRDRQNKDEFVASTHKTLCQNRYPEKDNKSHKIMFSERLEHAKTVRVIKTKGFDKSVCGEEGPKGT